MLLVSYLRDRRLSNPRASLIIWCFWCLASLTLWRRCKYRRSFQLVQTHTESICGMWHSFTAGEHHHSWGHSNISFHPEFILLKIHVNNKLHWKKKSLNAAQGFKVGACCTGHCPAEFWVLPGRHLPLALWPICFPVQTIKNTYMKAIKFLFHVCTVSSTVKFWCMDSTVLQVIKSSINAIIKCIQFHQLFKYYQIVSYLLWTISRFNWQKWQILPCLGVISVVMLQSPSVPRIHPHSTERSTYFILADKFNTLWVGLYFKAATFKVSSSGKITNHLLKPKEWMHCICNQDYCPIKNHLFLEIFTNSLNHLWKDLCPKRISEHKVWFLQWLNVSLSEAGHLQLMVSQWKMKLLSIWPLVSQMVFCLEQSKIVSF